MIFLRKKKKREKGIISLEFFFCKNSEFDLQYSKLLKILKKKKILLINLLHCATNFFHEKTEIFNNIAISQIDLRTFYQGLKRFIIPSTIGFLSSLWEKILFIEKLPLR